MQTGRQPLGSAGSRDTLNNLALAGQPSVRLNQQRYSDLDEGSIGNCRSTLNLQRQSIATARQANQPARPTKISVTAPSPMGSLRDINRLTSSLGLDSACTGGSMSTSQSKQRIKQLYKHDQDLAERASQLSLTDHQGLLNLVDDGSAPLAGPLDQLDQHGSDAIPLDKEGERSRSQLIDELLRTINDDSFNNFVDLNNKYAAKSAGGSLSSSPCAGSSAGVGSTGNTSQPRPKSAMDSVCIDKLTTSNVATRPRALGAGSNSRQSQQQSQSTFDNVIRRMSTNLVQNFNKIGSTNLGTTEQQDGSRRDKTPSHGYANTLYVDNQVPTRRHSDNTINIPRIQVALSSPQAGNSRAAINQRASMSATKLANKWKLSAKSNQREASDKLSPNLAGALGYMRRHSSGNTTGNNQGQSNGPSTNLFNSSPFKVSGLVDP